MHKRDATLAVASLVVLALFSMAQGQDPQPSSEPEAPQAPAQDPAAVEVSAGVQVSPGDPSAAQDAPLDPASMPELVFEREVFTYNGAGRRDPFKPLTDGDMGPLFEDLTLRMIIYSAAAPGESVAVIGDGAKKTYRVRRGDLIGSASVVEISPKRVVFSVNELGNWRREVLELKPDNK